MVSLVRMDKKLMDYSVVEDVVVLVEDVAVIIVTPPDCREEADDRSTLLMLSKVLMCDSHQLEGISLLNSPPC